MSAEAASAASSSGRSHEQGGDLKQNKGNIIQELRRLPKKQIAKETLNDLKGDDVPGLAAEIAYYAIFAIPPMIIFFVTLAAVVNQFTGVPVAERMTDIINQRAPTDMRAILNSLVDNALQKVSGGVASFGVAVAALIALWSGSNGVAALIKAFNRAYDVEETRSWFKKKAIAIGLTVLIAFLVNAAFVLFVFGQQIGQWIADKVGLSGAFTLVWSILRWPMAILFIIIVLATLYYLGPNVEQTFRWLSPGSVVATLLWITITFGFRFYLTISNPGSAYGTLGSVVVLLYFLFLTGIVFVLGAEVNAIVGRRYDPETVADLAKNPDKIESAKAQMEAQNRAEGLDRREGGDVAGEAKRRAYEPGRKSAVRDPAKQPASSSRRQPSRGEAIVSTLAGLALATFLSRKGRDRP